MVLKRTHVNNTLQQDKTQTAENNSSPPVSMSWLKAGALEVSYTMGVQDWVTAYWIGITHLRRLSSAASNLWPALFCFVLWIAFAYYGYAHAWHRRHSCPWHYIHIMLLASTAGPIAFAFVLWSMSSRRVVLEDACIIVQFKYGGIARSRYSGKLPFSWQRVSNIFQEAEHTAICSDNYVALVVPRRAFPDEQAATAFFDTAVNFWHEAKGTLPPPAPETASVWPSAPRSANSAEPSDGPEC